MANHAQRADWAVHGYALDMPTHGMSPAAIHEPTAGSTSFVMPLQISQSLPASLQGL